MAVASAGAFKCAPRSRQITMPAPHHSSFLQAGCPSCRPTNSIKALKEQSIISLLRKKPTLDKEELSDCRTISNLSHFQNSGTCCQIPSHGSPHFQQFTQFSPVSLLQTSLHRNSSFVHPRSPHQCSRITESIMPLLTRPPCCFRHY